MALGTNAGYTGQELTQWVKGQVDDLLLPRRRAAREAEEEGKKKPKSEDMDTLGQAREPIISLLKDSWVVSCSLILFTDGSTSFRTISQVFQNISDKYVPAHIEIERNSEINSTLYQVSSGVEIALKIKLSSMCLTLLLVSDDKEFLNYVIRTSFNEGLLTKQTRSMIVTRVQLAGLRLAQEMLSLTNSIVLNLDYLQTTRRCRAFAVIPYSFRMMLIAYWIPAYGLVYSSEHKPYPEKFRKMIDGANMSIAAVTYLPHIRVTANSTAVSITGPLIDVLNLLAKKMNFTYTLVPENSYGYLLPNGTWNGLVGLVLRKNVDFALGPLAITYARSKVIDYTEPLLVDYLVLQAKRGGIEIDPWSFALPFTASVWASLFATFFLSIITAVVFNHEAKEWSPSSASPLVYFKVLMSQDVDRTNYAWWERMIVGGWMVVVLIALESYSGNLMSQLAVRYIAQPYQSLQIVLDDPKIKMMWVSDTVYVQYYKSSTSGILYEVAKSEEKGKITFAKSIDYFTAMNTLVARGDHVSVNPYLSARFFLTEAFTDGGNCRFYLSRERYLPFTFAMIVQKNSPVLQGINDGAAGAGATARRNWEQQGSAQDSALAQEKLLTKEDDNPHEDPQQCADISELFAAFQTVSEKYSNGESAAVIRTAVRRLKQLRSENQLNNLLYNLGSGTCNTGAGRG
ncbi:ionotropic receptor 93a-like [Macrobrachium nipponense]|uniref:ionotropic receptor 93a-like n=1 Tax=Macrobrachium nipponense TaxID=159736 RepID=UPI0030C83723